MVTPQKSSTNFSQYSHNTLSIPQHVAIIMDGNGRWAQKRNLPRSKGHIAGYKNISNVVRAFADKLVSTITLFGFSTENWNRPKEEVYSIMQLAEHAQENIKEMHANNVRIQHIGRTDHFDAKTYSIIEYAVNLTKHNTGLNLNFAFDYGGRYDIIHAVKQIVSEGWNTESITEETFCKMLMTKSLTDVDLLIRTGNEFRISNFLLWHLAYSELYFSERFWPDFGEEEIQKSLEFYALRSRKFGRVI